LLKRFVRLSRILAKRYSDVKTCIAYQCQEPPRTSLYASLKVDTKHLHLFIHHNTPPTAMGSRAVSAEMANVKKTGKRTRKPKMLTVCISAMSSAKLNSSHEPRSEWK